MFTREHALPAAVRLWAIAVMGESLAAGQVDAQFPDVLSDAECPGCAAALERPPLAVAGTWSTALTSADDPAWAIEDFVCFVGCTAEARAHAARLVRDPANAPRTIVELLPTAIAANARPAAHVTGGPAHARPPAATTFTAPGFGCDPSGFASQVLSHLPMRIEQLADRIVMRYEELGATRTIFLDEIPASAEPTPFGISRGRIENDVLIVETSRIPPGRLHDWFGGGSHSGHLHATEQYRTSDDGRWLDLTLELYDPETLREPLVVTKRWRRAPDARLATYHCDIMSAQLGPVFAEYVDPKPIDARRRAEIAVH